jgi:catechol 2,3-dioxygenase-like lactoylglutathione lyase family enzyme
MLANYNLVTFIPTTDVARSKAFYSETLGLTFVSQDAFAAVFDVNGIMLRITAVGGHKPWDHTVLGWSVPDIMVAAAHLVKAGVKLEKYPFLEQDELGIWTAPGAAAKVAWFKDPDGNVLSISQH